MTALNWAVGAVLSDAYVRKIKPAAGDIAAGLT
jgi:hypothetical protein